MAHRARDTHATPVQWHTGRDYNDREGLHLWAEVDGARVEIRKRVSRLLGSASNGYRVWEVVVNGERRPAHHPSLRAAKEAVEGRNHEASGVKSRRPTPPLWAAMDEDGQEPPP